MPRTDMKSEKMALKACNPFQIGPGGVVPLPSERNYAAVQQRYLA